MLIPSVFLAKEADVKISVQKKRSRYYTVGRKKGTFELFVAR